MRKYVSLVAIGGCVFVSMTSGRADTVVSDGKFTNVYVYPDPNSETWEQHLQRLDPSLKPSDWQQFTRQSIDAFTEALMSPTWPSYFGALHQYGGINPPRFFGSYIISQACWEAAKKDLHGPDGVLEWPTAGALANCHIAGGDPSPQVNLIFSPDIKVGEGTLTADGPDMCADVNPKFTAYHSGGLNQPNFAALPTAHNCTRNFADFTESLSHEDVEILSNPGDFGHGSPIFNSDRELADQCKSARVIWKGFIAAQYRSDNDDGCWPLKIPDYTTATTWMLGEGSPIVRFTGDLHSRLFKVPEGRLLTDADAKEVQLWIQTGSDDLRGGRDNADATLIFAAGAPTKSENINQGREWGNGQTHIARLSLPSGGVRVRDIQGVMLTTHFTGGIDGDNWNVDEVALMIGFAEGSPTTNPVLPKIRDWLDVSGGPLVRFTGSDHDYGTDVTGQDRHERGQWVRALELIISTGNDDLRGGSHAGDNCDVTIELNFGKPPIVLTNVNEGQTWKNWTDHTVSIPLTAGGLRSGDLKAVRLHTGFGGGIGGDNWNVQRIRLKATL